MRAEAGRTKARRAVRRHKNVFVFVILLLLLL